MIDETVPLGDVLPETYKGLELHEIPNNWQWAPFGLAANIESNLVDPLPFGDMPHIAPNHIESLTGRLLSYSTIAEDGVSSGKHVFYPGQLLYSKIRPYLRKAVVVNFSGLCSADMYPISGKESSVIFLKYWLLSDDFNSMAAMSQDRTVLPKINQITLNSIPIPQELHLHKTKKALPDARVWECRSHSLSGSVPAF
ncbi:restriction endonuclease subunit S, partial [Deinococcus sp. Leaf326]|uniref:restriction endonuclease subunit S n=1 Tax=Deinococcus sp. Leaf326 TaxID=1736338 RepID=UPI00138F82B1